MPPGPAGYHILMQRDYFGRFLREQFFEKTVLVVTVKKYILFP